MRLNPDKINFLKQSIHAEIPGASVYLFGSRTDDTARGGDIDLMIITDQPVDKHILRKIKIAFIKKFGWQRLDLVNFASTDHSPFRKVIETNCIAL